MCPSCCTRRMAATATHLVEHVFPELLVRQWAVPFPKRLRYFLHSDGFGFTGSQRTSVYPEGRDQGIECRVWPPNGLEKMAFEPPILGTGRQGARRPRDSARRGSRGRRTDRCRFDPARSGFLRFFDSSGEASAVRAVSRRGAVAGHPRQSGPGLRTRGNLARHRRRSGVPSGPGDGCLRRSPHGPVGLRDGPAAAPGLVG